MSSEAVKAEEARISKAENDKIKREQTQLATIDALIRNLTPESTQKTHTAFKNCKVRTKHD